MNYNFRRSNSAASDWCASLCIMRSAQVAFAVLLLGLSGWTQKSQKETAAPDVVLITIDTLRADHVGCYGFKSAKTPTLDSLFSEGILFRKAITASPITNTSHASILTGLYPAHHGVSDFGVALSDSHVTVAELLHKKGYHTAAFIGAVILDSKTLAPGFDRGFDFYDNFPAKTLGAHWDRIERRAEEVVLHAQHWLKSNRMGPRFLWVHLYDPHDPYEPPPPYAAQFKFSPYDGEIAYADHAVSSLLATLKAQNRYDSSLIIVMGDHGEGLGEHHEDTHGIFLYDSTLHIPLIIKLPAGIRRGSTVETQVRSVDVLPTILEITGTATDAKFDGESLLGIFSKTSTGRLAISETDYPLRFGWAPIRSVRSNDHKYIEAPRPELYRLKDDPKESKNLYQPWNETVQDFRKVLAAYRVAAQQVGSIGTAPVPSSTIEELKALGYLGTVAGSTTVPEVSLLPDPKDKIDVQNQIHEGMVKQERGDLPDAIQRFAKAVELDPESGMAINQLGQAELMAHQYEAAAEHLRAAHGLLPKDNSITLKYGEALYHRGDLLGAAKVLEQALESTPGQYAARVMLGEIYLARNETSAAQDQFEAAILVDAEGIRAHFLLAKIYLSRNELVPARQQLHEVLRINPKNAEARNMLVAISQR